MRCRSRSLPTSLEARSGWQNWGVVAVFAGLVSLPPAPLVLAQEGTRPACSLTTFDAAWQLIYNTHFDPQFNGVDWEAVRDELRPRAEEAATEGELREVLQEMIGRLGQSHFGLIPGPSGATRRRPETSETTPTPPPAERETQDDVADRERETLATACDSALGRRVQEMESGLSLRIEATPGIETRLLGDEVVVVGVEPGSAAAEAGVHPGWRVERIDGEGVTDLLHCTGSDPDPDGFSPSLAHTVVSGLLAGDTGTEVEVEFGTAERQRRSLLLRRQEPPGRVIRFGNLPPIRQHLTHTWLEIPDVDARIGLIRFNIWLVPTAGQFSRAIDELRSADGLILDLRGNPGGVAGVAQGVAGHFIDENLTLGTMKTRRDELELRINPQRVSPAGKRVRPFAGPLAILIDSLTGSTSEIFAAALQDHGRARLFGEASAAAALPAAMDRLPNGDVLIHATADFIRPSGRPIEGQPVRPDETVLQSREGLLEGHDEPLAAARRWILEQLRDSSPASPDN